MRKANEHLQLGTQLHSGGFYVRAQAELRAALGIRQQAWQGSEHPGVAESHLQLGTTLSLLAKFDEAHVHLTRGLEMLQTAWRTDGPKLAEVRHQLGEIHRQQGNPDQAM